MTRIATVGALRAALARFPDDLPLVTCDESAGTFDGAGVLLRRVAYSAEWSAVKFLDAPDPPGSGPELGEDIGWGEDCEADCIEGLYLYPDALDGDDADG